MYKPALWTLSPVILRSEEQCDFTCRIGFAAVIAQVACMKLVLWLWTAQPTTSLDFKRTWGFKNNSAARELCTCYCCKEQLTSPRQGSKNWLSPCQALVSEQMVFKPHLPLLCLSSTTQSSEPWYSWDSLFLFSEELSTETQHCVSPLPPPQRHQESSVPIRVKSFLPFTWQG